MTEKQTDPAPIFVAPEYGVPTGMVPRPSTYLGLEKVSQSLLIESLPTPFPATPLSFPYPSPPVFPQNDFKMPLTEDRRKHNHYFKDVSRLQFIDVYRVLSLFNVTDPSLQHAIKKLLVAGGRGAKDITKDIQEAIDSCNRALEIRKEDNGTV